MRKKHKKIYLGYGIRLANEVTEIVKSDTSFFCFLEEEENIIHTCFKPMKTSALHYFIFAVYKTHIVNHGKELIRENEYEEDILDELEKIVQDFEIEEIINEKCKKELKEENLEKIFDFIMYEDKVIEGFVESAFYILFSDRRFLHDFNFSLCNFINQIPDFQMKYKDQLNTKGKVKRARFPNWLKDAIFHRDKGVCVECRRDLTGIVNSDFSRHIDHIIPLDYGKEGMLGGTNDSSNFQLYCDKCNLKKGSRNTNTNNINIPWWD